MYLNISGGSMLDKQKVFNKLENRIAEIIGHGEIGERNAKLMEICELLESLVPYYNWVGFYIVDPETDRELILGPYVGEPTDHTRIPFGQGICGQAAEREETFLIQDVSKESNYLSCSINVRSEIVVPIMRDGVVLGELDIDSHAISPFTEEDSRFLENLTHRISGLFS